MKLAGALADAVEGRLHFIPIDAGSTGDEPRDRRSMARNDDLLALPHAIKQFPELLPCLSYADFIHGGKSRNT